MSPVSFLSVVARLAFIQLIRQDEGNAGLSGATGKPGSAMHMSMKHTHGYGLSAGRFPEIL
jgi:hypothetical protein